MIRVDSYKCASWLSATLQESFYYPNKKQGLVGVGGGFF